MENSIQDKIKQELAKKLSVYIPAIVQKYGRFMNENQRDKLQNLNDYKELLHFDYSGNVTAYASKTGITLPIGSLRAFEIIINLPNAGANKNHKCFTLETLIENDNTFEEYIEHLILIKADILTYLNDLLLHETMHFCGSGGSNTLGAGAFREGLNEYLTRLVAKENNFQTSGCGYPKEIKVVIAMEKVLGSEILTRIAFLNDMTQINEYLTKNVDADKLKLFNGVVSAMEGQFHNKYFSKREDFVGFEGAIKKAENYKNIDYTEVFNMIEDYYDMIENDLFC